VVGHYRTPCQRLGTVKIVPDEIEMIKTEKVGMEYGWDLGGSGVLKVNMVQLKR